MRQQHSGRLDAYRGDVVLSSDGLDAAAFLDIVDDGARSLGIHSVQQAYGDVRVARRLDTGRMEYLGTEVPELGGLVKVQVTHGGGTVHHAGVVVVHAVYIRPYLYFLRLQRSTAERSGVIGASAQQIVHLPMQVAADEALGNVKFGVRRSSNHSLESGLDVLAVRLALGIRFHKVQSIEQHRFISLLEQVIIHHMGGQELALGHYEFLLRLSEKILGEALEIVKNPACILGRLLLELILGIQTVDMLDIKGFQPGYGLISSLGILVVKIIGNLHKTVGSARHCGQHYKISLFGSYQRCHVFDSLSRTD